MPHRKPARPPQTFVLKGYGDAIQATSDCLTRFREFVAQREASRLEPNVSPLKNKGRPAMCGTA